MSSRPAMETGAGPSQALDRFAGLLFALAEAGGPLPAAELASRAGLPASSTYRLVQALERHDLVVRRERGGVALGMRLLELARPVEERLERTLLEPARAVMLQLAAEHRETVLLTAPVGARAIGLGSIESPRPIRLTYARWRLAPMHLGASGKILLAFLETAAAEAVLRIAARDPQVDTDRLGQELRDARARGYVVTREELDEGASGVAVPILDRRGRLVAGLTVAGPSDRVRAAQAAIVEALVPAARRIGDALA